MVQKKTGKRRPISAGLKREVLAEAGYRCAVPTCRSILAIDLHHIIEVEAGGANTLANLLALCPTCHALYTRGFISHEAINAWKTMLVSLNHAFDQESISYLLFLQQTQGNDVLLSGDGVLHFSHLIAAGLAMYQPVPQGDHSLQYVVRLTSKGSQIITSWFSGNREEVRQALNDLTKLRMGRPN
jgi:hypothetical protein